MITQLYWFLQDYQRNAFGVGAPTDAVLEVGGTPSEPFDQIVRAYLAAPGQLRRTAGTRLRAALRLGKAAVTPLPGIPTALPDLPNAALAIESASWRGSHLRAGKIPDGSHIGASPADAANGPDQNMPQAWF